MGFENYTPPSKDICFMKQVYLTAERSKDPSTKIGSVLVRDGNVIGSGYNGFARKVLDLPERYNNRETKYLYVVHSEENAILTCARLGISTINSILYTQSIPCHNCAKAVIQGGVVEIIIHSLWPMSHSKWSESSEISKKMFNEAGVNIRYISDKLGMKGYSNGELIEI
jgi:dCMP deaminase